MKKEDLVEVMIERINIYKRKIAVQQGLDLIELEKEILSSQIFLRQVLLGFYDLLLENKKITEGIDL